MAILGHDGRHVLSRQGATVFHGKSGKSGLEICPTKEPTDMAATQVQLPFCKKILGGNGAQCQVAPAGLRHTCASRGAKSAAAFKTTTIAGPLRGRVSDYTLASPGRARSRNSRNTLPSS